MSNKKIFEENIKNDDIFKVIDLYFNEQFALYGYQLSAYNQFLETVATQEIELSSHIIHEEYKDKLYRYSLRFKNVSIKPPINDNGNEEEILTPEFARINFLSYYIKLIADIQQIQEIIDYEPNGMNPPEIKIIAEEKGVTIAKLPLMVRSNYCTTVLKKDDINNECRFDPGCYFIVKGAEKIVIGLEKICDNKMLVFTKKDLNYNNGLLYTCQVNSRNMNYENIDGYNHNIQIISVKIKKDNTITLNMSQFAEIPIFIFFRALGIVTDKDIINNIIYDINDSDMISLLEISQNKAKEEIIKTEKGDKQILTQEDAYQFLMAKMKNKRYVDNNLEVKNVHRNAQKKNHLEHFLSRDFLPHMGVTKDKILNKAFYLGKMINKLLSCYLGRITIDDRDSFINKRVDLPGALMMQLFRQYFKKMLNDCGKYFKKKNNGNHTQPIDIIKMIKFGTIEQAFTTALSVGTWGSAKRKGVAQMLQRLSYKQFVSYLRRIMPPQTDASNSKVTSMRHVNNIQYGFIDAVESPDGHKIGLHKHLSLMASVTMNLDLSQINIIKSEITKAYFVDDNINYPYLLLMTNVDKIDLKIHTHININGEWIGITKEPLGLANILKEKRKKGIINRMTSINFNIKINSIDIYTDGGRLIRPLLNVKNNKLLLTKEMINEIDLTTNDKTKITRWNEIIEKYPDIIEYVDVEESENLMIAMYNDDVIEQRNKMLTIIKNPNKNGDIVNRYNDTVYIKYTHCEFHPMMSLGILSANIPFAEHNQAPRNYYSFAQSKQGMGIYASNHRKRVDLSYLLFHPSKPLVTTRAAKYTHELDIPAGENIIVAIACYTGYNQEDSVVVNKSSCERGMFRSISLKKYQSTIQKNNTTGQNDRFMKPDPNIVSGMKEGNYDKLNSLGYIPEETLIVNGDIIIGKCTPIVPNGTTNKVWKDDSEGTQYKSSVSARIDKVYTGIINSEGYESYYVRVRSERIPNIGDKMASRHGQKGVCGLLLSQQDLPFTKDGIQPDIIINPCCIPSRMTIAQLIECVFSKVGALKGELMDGTPFEKIDINSISNMLKDFGYDENGCEEMYCGMTGKKFMSKIFIGPTFYMRLKHMVSDKIHSRATGPRQRLTRQPPEGRARDGGLRFGEMERDAMISHGCALFLKERLVDTSDIYTTYVCNKCGIIASKKPKKDVWMCLQCSVNKNNNKNTNIEISKIVIPYAFKLLIQELMAINILPRIKVKQDYEYE